MDEFTPILGDFINGRQNQQITIRKDSVELNRSINQLDLTEGKIHLLLKPTWDID